MIALVSTNLRILSDPSAIDTADYRIAAHVELRALTGADNTSDHFTGVNPAAQRREVITYPAGIEFVKPPPQTFLTVLWAEAQASLASHWPVETVSAKLLTTELFKRQSADAKLSRAQALRDASLAVMQQTAGKSYSYAHPMFWAPFVVFGDGG